MDSVIHTVFITYNRLELSKRAIASYLETVDDQFSFVVVDNASTDGTGEWLAESGYNAVILPENRYPGYATNLGFALAPEKARFLHRADNDFEFLPGWLDEVKNRFAHIRKLGQLGLRTSQEEKSKINVGGNCVFRRAVWDKGIRYDERPWPQLRDEVGAGWTEDSLMSSKVRELNYHWTRVTVPCIRPLSFDDPSDPYYLQTWADRGI